MPKLIAILAAVLVGAVVALGLCQAVSGREGVASTEAGKPTSTSIPPKLSTDQNEPNQKVLIDGRNLDGKTGFLEKRLGDKHGAQMARSFQPTNKDLISVDGKTEFFEKRLGDYALVKPVTNRVARSTRATTSAVLAAAKRSR